MGSKGKMKMCEVCKNLDLENFVDYEVHKVEGAKKLDIPRAELFNNEQRGCEMCEIITKAIELARKPTILDKYIRTVRAVKYEPGSISLAYVNRDSEDASARCHIYTVPGTSACRKWPQIGSRSQGSIDQNAVSEETLSRACSWLKECTEHHLDCDTVREVELPTRLIKVGGTDKKPRLVITRDMRGKYATLSHCWGAEGRPRPLTTTKETLDERIAGISFDDLPRTFRDAIVVTRALGLTYLWIDSLCIIQDSREYWEKECKEMHSIYANAVINISADSATDSSMGLGRTGDLSPCLASSPISRCKGVRVSTGEQPSLDGDCLSHFKPVPKITPVKDIQLQHELQTRAWVLQERMLSRRVLHFCHSELVWECDTHITCECSPQRSDTRPNNIRQMPTSEMLQLDTITPWGKIANLYSAMKLTFEDDRSNAIAGLAIEASEQWSMTYISGLWKEQLPLCLLWYSVGAGRRTKIPCPSWSWLSLSGPVWFRPDYKPDDKWAADDYEFVGGEEVRNGGIIRVKGVLATFTFDDDGEISSQTADGEKVALRGQIIADIRDGTEFADSQYYLLRVVSSARTDYCLVLREVKGLGEGDVAATPDGEKQFQRVGFFRYSKPAGGLDIFHESSFVLV
ncbi:hypothetical protein ONS96_008700 [Cadophora gregata f. sp. sojae]|nr:hypothetical protein ONS96_008700 [Cadophora gregata f. sp. sojae]